MVLCRDRTARNPRARLGDTIRVVSRMRRCTGFLCLRMTDGGGRAGSLRRRRFRSATFSTWPPLGSSPPQLLGFSLAPAFYCLGRLRVGRSPASPREIPARRSNPWCMVFRLFPSAITSRQTVGGGRSQQRNHCPVRVVTPLPPSLLCRRVQLRMRNRSGRRMRRCRAPPNCRRQPHHSPQSSPRTPRLTRRDRPDRRRRRRCTVRPRSSQQRPPPRRVPLPCPPRTHPTPASPRLRSPSFWGMGTPFFAPVTLPPRACFMSALPL